MHNNNDPTSNDGDGHPPGPDGGPGRLAFTLDTMPAFVGQERGTGAWQAVTPARVAAFAACTGDDQWLHVDAARCARDSPFGAPIAQGFLVLSLVAPAVQALAVPPDAACVVNLGASDVRFLGPVRVGARVRARVGLTLVEPRDVGRWLLGASVTVEWVDAGEPDAPPAPVLTASLTLMVFR